MMLALVTLGLFSFKQLSIDMYPNVDIPVLTIVTKFPGASPEAVEREVTKRIEDAVNPIAGVKHVTSYSRGRLFERHCRCFNLEVKINEASQDARSKDRRHRGANCPRGSKNPSCRNLTWQVFPLFRLAVRSNTLTVPRLSTLVEKRIKKRIENIPGIGKINLVGLSKREVNVNVDPLRLQALGMGVDEVIAGLQSENVNTPLGRLNHNGSEYPLAHLR